MKFSRITITSFCLLLAFSSFGCAQNSTLQKKYGADASYFIALNELKENNTGSAIRNLKEAAKKGSPLISRRAMEKLAETGSLQERTEACRQLSKNFPDNSSLLIYTRELDRQKEYYSIMSKTDSIDIKTAPDELVFYRLLSMVRKNDSRLKKEFRLWLTDCSYSSWHNKFYAELKKADVSFSDSLADFLNLVFKKDYVSAAELINSVLEVRANRKPLVFSATGKTLLYGTKDFNSAAAYMDSLCKSCPDNCRFYCSFYAGRLYGKTGDSSKAIEKFSDAMEKAETDEQKDNALWYLFNESLNVSSQYSFEVLEKNIDKIKDTAYYNDFFDTLSVRLITAKKWELYKKTADLIKGKASPDAAAKFSYVTARLIQNGNLKNVPEEQAEEYFKNALNSPTDLYYKILSMEKLGLGKEEIEKELYETGNRTEISADEEKERLLDGYADFGLAEYLNDEYQNLKNNISTECAERIARFLWQCGTSDEKYLVQSIRIASRRVFNSEKKPDRELFELAFPQNYSEAVKKSCEDFSQPEYVLYALIRSESFFDSKVVSNAGATGLTQLMDSTAGDIARKLKLEEFDLTDSATNIMLGSFYLEELTRRLDGSIILAAFSYNGGIKRVRSWVKSAAVQFGVKELPKDLFLEAIPYTETREYGRKILSAAAIYGWLYYDLLPSETAEEIMN